MNSSIIRTPVWVLGWIIISAGIISVGLYFYNAFQMGNVQYTKHILSEYCIIISFFKESTKTYPNVRSFPQLIQKLSPEFTGKYYANLKKEFPDKMPKFYTNFLNLPVRDKWGHSLKYDCWRQEGVEHFRIASPGRDGIWEYKNLSEYKSNVISPADWNPNNDLIYSEEGAVQAPIQE